MHKKQSYAVVIGKWEHISPKCKRCIHLEKIINDNDEYYRCGKAPLMYPDCCPWFTNAQNINDINHIKSLHEK